MRRPVSAWEREDAPEPVRKPRPDETASDLAKRLLAWRTVRTRKRLTIPGPDRDFVEVPIAPEEKAAIEAEDERFRTWWEKFRLTKAGGRALKSFERARLPVRKRTDATVQADLHTLYRLARACYHAATWPGQSVHALLGAKERKRLRLKAAHHASQLADLLSQHAEPAGLFDRDLWVAMQSAWIGYVDRVEAIEREIRGLRDGTIRAFAPTQRAHWLETDALPLAQKAATHMRSRSLRAAWQHFFAALAESLRKAPRVSQRPTWKRGNLIYETRRKNGVPVMDKMPRRETMLGFELVFHLRRWSLGLGAVPWHYGEPMPKRGKPHYKVAAEFVEGALRSDLTANVRVEGSPKPVGILKERLKRLPASVRLGRWPHEKG